MTVTENKTVDQTVIVSVLEINPRHPVSEHGKKREEKTSQMPERTI